MTHTIETRYQKPDGSWASKDKRYMTPEEVIESDRFWSEVHKRHSYKSELSKVAK